MSPSVRPVHVEEVEEVVIRFAGDSGDGMQLTGTQFTNTAAIVGNDISTLPDFPAEIRAPAGTLAGVSGFQVHLASEDIFTPGDEPHVLIAMNPAALKASLGDLMPGGTIIVNSDEFTPANLKKAGYDRNPLDDGSLKGYHVHRVPITTLNRHAVEGVEGLSTKEVDRSRNFFALGLTFWIYDRPLDNTLKWIDEKFGKRPEIAEANRRALLAGYHFGDTTEAFQTRYKVKPAELPPGDYRKVTGNEALAMGLVTAAHLAGKQLIYCSYPITPASDILHTLASLKNYSVVTFQAEDEIAAMGATIGAAFGGAFAVTGTSGPGMALKSEAINLAVVLELPMVIVDVQRAGPSTGMPTKPEQGDLLQALFGRNGESPVPVVAPASPADCFDMAIEAFRLAVQAMSPVILLSDGYLANSAEPWHIPTEEELAQRFTFHIHHPTAAEFGNGHGFLPYARDPQTLARPWALPGTPGLEHRIGGLGKQPGTGNVSYAPEDHDRMVRDRAAKVARLAEFIPPLEVFGAQEGDLLVVGWGSSYGAIHQAVDRAHFRQGKSVGAVHLRYLNPFPRNLGEIMSRFEHILVPEMNLGQLAMLLKATFLRPVISMPKVRGRPFKISELSAKIDELLG
ncbi:MAG: 2-oxoacid:acceptor oxidoreductase subunit alpha [Caldilineales bacterium]|nr:2-oxoacid:acceptor oxidoreductase subunit alpha [Caldilineales bacterium]MDW8317241.1 2-oxoacid:acceptor oxidoreductase subunit alpha [Anaerolineae bacterium]